MTARPRSPALLIPHYIVLAGLWIAFAVMLLIAYVAVLATGRYPARLFTFSVGVLRWTWRVVYYGYVILGTDRYPPFTLKPVPDYPADLDIDATVDRHRWLPLVAWLLAVPHAMILSGLLNAHLVRIIQIDALHASIVIPVGVASIGITVIATQLAITGQHPRGLYDLFTGVARWSLRVVAYVALLTDVYPPFRLDQGATEPMDDHLSRESHFTHRKSTDCCRRPSPTAPTRRSRMIHRARPGCRPVADGSPAEAPPEDHADSAGDDHDRDEHGDAWSPSLRAGPGAAGSDRAARAGESGG